MRTDVYVGEKIKWSGVVFRSPEDLPNEFGVGIYYMTCCAADAQLVWLKYRTDKVVPHVGQRVEIAWIVDQDEEWKPIINTQSIMPIAPMEDPYTYY
jgi:uncharacterized membrane protein YcgQ (UPF0703/DUF1980 family)